jgi:nitrite reductase/ring-hydroxylating ferredoxin subunit
MNWFTKTPAASLSAAAKQKLVDDNDSCEHVQNDPSKFFEVSYENDSFGREGYCMCEACAILAQEQVQEETYVCADCKTEFPLKSGILWKWYAFYAAQGDEALPVCNACRPLPSHRARVRQDQDDYDDELSN